MIMYYKPIILVLAAASLHIAGDAATIKAPGRHDAPQSTSVYYFTPMGITFEGTDTDEKLGSDMAYAPVSFWLQTAAEISSGTPQWTYPVGVQSDGTERMGASTQTELNFRMTTKGKYSAPVLTSSAAPGTTYTVAGDGIMYGSLGSREHFAVNYRPAQTLGFETADEVLTCNSSSANAMMNMIMGGGLYSNIKIYGFAESFYYSKDFWIQAVNAEVSSATPITADDIAVTVFERVQTSVKTTEIGEFHVTDIHAAGNNRYFVTFEPEEPIFVTTAMQVVIHAPEGKNTQFAPVIPAQDSYHASNAGTASIYADFSLMNKPIQKQYIDFFGTEMTDDDDKSQGFINHWNVGILGSYEKPEAGVYGITADTQAAASPYIYNLQGICVATDGNLDRLPSGIYITNGKKIIK